MRISILSMVMFFSLATFSQQERDTVLGRCPLYITDTTTSNNFFLEARPATLKVFRVRGELTIVIEQKEQSFTLLFRDKKLKNTKYKISVNPDSKGELAAKYSFRSGEQVSYVNVSKGTVEVMYDKVKKLWYLKVNGMIANLVERSVTYYRVKADFTIK